MEQQAEKQVLAAFRLPAITGLTASGCLIFSGNKGNVGGSRGAVAGEVGIGGIHLVELYHLEKGRSIQHEDNNLWTIKL